MNMETHWQNCCNLLKQRSEHLLNNRLYTDCSFIVGTGANRAIFYCHRLILAVASPVFGRLYFERTTASNSLFESGMGQCYAITIPDVTPIAFGHMIKYIYTDELHLKSIDEAIEVSILARRYMMLYIMAECDKYIFAHVRPDSVLKCYEFANGYFRHNLEDYCKDKIIHDTANILQFPSFLKIKFSTLLMILEQNYLNIGCELLLFDAVYRYGAANQLIPRIQPSYNPINDNIEYSDQSSPTETASSSESIVGVANDREPEFYENNESNTVGRYQKWYEALKKIRVLSMTPKEFAFGPAKAKVFNPLVSLACLLFLIRRDSDDSGLPSYICRSTTKRYKTNGF